MVRKGRGEGRGEKRREEKRREGKGRKEKISGKERKSTHLNQSQPSFSAKLRANSSSVLGSHHTNNVSKFKKKVKKKKIMKKTMKKKQG